MEGERRLVGPGRDILAAGVAHFSGPIRRTGQGITGTKYRMEMALFEGKRGMSDHLSYY